jgi:hypothetical protein
VIFEPSGDFYVSFNLLKTAALIAVKEKGELGVVQYEV